jgi:hypothetical protein
VAKRWGPSGVHEYAVLSDMPTGHQQKIDCALSSVTSARRRPAREGKRKNLWWIMPRGGEFSVRWVVERYHPNLSAIYIVAQRVAGAGCVQAKINFGPRAIKIHRNCIVNRR